MIYITKLNQQKILLNNDLIEHIEETPDTVITMTTGRKMVVVESMQEIYAKVMEAKQIARQTGFITD